ncbi:MAG: HEAT repeat domain-containing protein [Propionibacteriaceae bacterium]|nr:HEAT repeat domain-containing protein [Propionibacteriaceae bacterium]
MTQYEPSQSRVESALTSGTASTRLQAALFAGTHPGVVPLAVLVERCAVEPDFFVRDMLSWALTRYDHSAVLERLLVELRSDTPQARSQALHTLSKIGDQRAWGSVVGFLRDPDDEIARTAWRAAATLVPEGEQGWLADSLATQLGRGDPELQRSLSRALTALGAAATPAIARARGHRDQRVRAHALATERLVQDPDVQFAAALAEANRVLALGGVPTVQE